MDINYPLMGKRIREARKLRGLTGETLAGRIGITPESLRHIEGAASKPSLQTLYRIAEVLDVSMDHLTGRTPALTDQMLQGYGMSEEQEEVVHQLLDSIVPIITRCI